MLDAFGLPQPQTSFTNRVLLGARYAPFGFPVDAVERTYLEVTFPGGSLFQPGLPLPYRDGKVGLNVASQGLLGTTGSIEIKVWGADTGDTTTNVGIVGLRIGPDVITTNLNSGVVTDSNTGFSVDVRVLPYNTFKTVVLVGSTGKSVAFTGLTPVTLTTGIDESQTLTISGTAFASTALTINGAEVWYVDLLPVALTDSRA